MAEEKPAASRAARSKGKATERTDLVAAEDLTQVAVVPATTILTPEQKEILAADEATSEVTAGGAEKADEGTLRSEGAEGVATPYKADPANPESPIVYAPEQGLYSPAEPAPVTVGVGETAAQHEAHVLVNSPAHIAERLEKESGEDALPTWRIARDQQEKAADLEFQRVQSGTAPVEAETLKAKSQPKV